MNEMTLRLSRETGVPMFQQLYEFLKAEIVSGHISSNERLPSKRKLAAHLGCSRNTVEAAYNQLVDEGYPHRKSRRAAITQLSWTASSASGARIRRSGGI